MISKRITLEIIVDNIKVDERYYSFDYKVLVDGKVQRNGNHSDSHEVEKYIMEDWLKDTYAYDIVLEHYGFDF